MVTETQNSLRHNQEMRENNSRGLAVLAALVLFAIVAYVAYGTYFRSGEYAMPLEPAVTSDTTTNTTSQ